MERQSRVILIAAVISAVVGLATGFLGGRLAAPPAPVATPAAAAGAVVQAQAFQLVDQAGRVRGRLGVEAHGAARLTLFGPDGTLPRVSLAATSQGGAELELGDGQHQNAMSPQSRPGRPKHRLIPRRETAPGAGGAKERRSGRQSL